MGFRNPITSLPASDITSGNLTGSYTLPGTIIIGNPAASHLELGTHPDSTEGLRLYGPDGVTVLVEIDTTNGGQSSRFTTSSASGLVASTLSIQSDTYITPSVPPTSGGGTHGLPPRGLHRSTTDVGPSLLWTDSAGDAVAALYPVTTPGGVGLELDTGGGGLTLDGAPVSQSCTFVGTLVTASSGTITVPHDLLTDQFVAIPISNSGAYQFTLFSRTTTAAEFIVESAAGSNVGGGVSLGVFAIFVTAGN